MVKTRKVGRPKKKCKLSINTGRKPSRVDESSYSTKRRRAQEIADNPRYDIQVLEMALKIMKNRSADSELMDIDECNTEENYRHTSESALALSLEFDLSKESYQGIARDLKDRKCKLYISYPTMSKAKEDCKPKNYNISEVEVSVPLQSMMKKTSERLCEAVATSWPESALSDLDLLVSIGFDSSSGHVNPQQKFDYDSNEDLNPHQSLLVSSMLIIQLKSNSESEYEWINPTPQSYRFCRPIRIAHEKEDDEAIHREYNRLQKEIESLVRHRFTMSNGKSVRVRFEISKTLFDGKCVNTIVGNPATTRCPMCLITNHNFNNQSCSFTPNEESLNFGLGLLHAEIKCLEQFLNLSYKKIIGQWDVTQEYKDRVQTEKFRIQKKLYDAMGIRVDQVIQGKGTSNTGNLARKCFMNPKLFADALEIDNTLVSNVALILLAFKCKLKLNLEELENFCTETYDLFYKLYSWARMSPTVHKLLKHGCDITRKFPLPIAYFAEDANESMHKIYRDTKKNHARLSSRENCILDTYNRAVYLTDPVISMIYIERRIKMHKKQKLPLNIKRFLVDVEDVEFESSEDEEFESSSEEEL